MESLACHSWGQGCKNILHTHCLQLPKQIVLHFCTSSSCVQQVGAEKCHFKCQTKSANISVATYKPIGVQAMGRKGHANQKSKPRAPNLDVNAVGQGLVLIGDLGFANCTSGSQVIKTRQIQRQEGKAMDQVVGYSNISLLGGFINLQQENAAGPAAS